MRRDATILGTYNLIACLALAGCLGLIFSPLGRQYAIWIAAGYLAFVFLSAAAFACMWAQQGGPSLAEMWSHQGGPSLSEMWSQQGGPSLSEMWSQQGGPSLAEMWDRDGPSGAGQDPAAGG